MEFPTRPVVLSLLAGLIACNSSGFDLEPGWVAYRAGQPREALRTALKSLEHRPSDSSAMRLAARSLVQLGRFSQAEDYFRRIVDLDRSDLHARAFGLIRLNEPNHAATLYLQILANNPDDEMALQRLAAVRIGQERWRDAMPPAERLSQISATASLGYFLLGFIHHHAKHPAEAVEAFEKVLEHDPRLEKITISPVVFWDHLALDLLAQGRIAEARRHLEHAMKGLQDGGLMELLGSAYHQEGDLIRAEQCWRRAVEMAPANSDAWLGLGRLALGRRRPDEAINPLLHAVELSPSAYEPHYLLSQAYRRLGQAVEADRHQNLAKERRKP